MSTFELPRTTVRITSPYGRITEAQVGLNIKYKDQLSTITPYIHFGGNDPFTYTGSDGFQWLKESFAGDVTASSSPPPQAEEVNLRRLPLTDFSRHLADAARLGEAPRPPLTSIDYNLSKDRLPPIHREVVDSLLTAVSGLYDQVWDKIAEQYKSTAEEEQSVEERLFKYAASHDERFRSVLPAVNTAFRSRRAAVEADIRIDRLLRGRMAYDVPEGIEAYMVAREASVEASVAWRGLQSTLAWYFPAEPMPDSVEGIEDLFERVKRTRG